MDKIGIIMLALSLTACASVPPPEPDFCEPAQSNLRGIHDAQQGSPSSSAFSQLCSLEKAPLAKRRYREGYASVRAEQRQKNLAALEKESEEEANRALQSIPDANAWVCEVEASSKIFTGVGVSLEDARRSAKDTCGAHFQSSYCTQAECKQNL